MALRIIENNYETVEQWVAKYNLLATDIGDFSSLSYTASDIIDGLNVNDQRIDDLEIYVGPHSNFDVMNTAGIVTGDIVTQAIGNFWGDYVAVTGRGTTFITAATSVIPAINELKTDVNDLSADLAQTDAAAVALDTRVGPNSNLSDLTIDGFLTSPTDITDGLRDVWNDYRIQSGRSTTLITTSQTIRGGVNEVKTDFNNLSADLSNTNTVIGELTALDAGIFGSNNDSIVAAINYIYNLQTGTTVNFTNATVSGTLDVAGLTTLSSLTVDGAAVFNNTFTSRGIDDNATEERLELSNSIVTVKTDLSGTGNITAAGNIVGADLQATGKMLTSELRTGNGNHLILSAGESHSHAVGQTAEVVYVNAESGMSINTSPDNWVSGWAGRDTTVITGNAISVNGFIVWHAGNDGTGSGLDADTVDGVHASSFARLSGNQTFANDVTVQGDLNVQGEINAISSNEINVGDSFINLNQDQTGTPTTDAGIKFGRGSLTDAQFYWDESEDKFFVFNGSTTGEVVTTIGGVNATTLNGQGTAYYLAWANITGKPSTFTPSAHNHSAANITSGTFAVARIPALPATQITSGTFATARIPALPATQITSGTFADGRIPALDAGKTTTGIFATGRIPNLAASKITSGVLTAARIPALPASQITSGTLNASRIPNLDSSKITSGILNIARLPAITFEKVLASDVLLSTETWSTSNSVFASAAAIESRILSKGYITNINGFSTSNLSEGTNLYHTTARVQAVVTTAYLDTKNINAGFLGGQSAGSFVRSDTDDNVLGHTEWQDGFQVRLGNSADMRIHHTSSSNFVDLYNGNLFVRDNATTRFTFAKATGNFTATGDITAFSDKNLKKDFAAIEGLNTIEKLNPVYYDWNDKAEEIGIVSKERQVGVIAQEVEEHFPEAIGQELEGYKTVSYEKLVPLLLASLKELNEKVKALEANA